jgi:putative hydrolase of the HAD superfamily
MGIAAESALYVGNDLRNDIQPAAQAGFRTALFAGDRRSLRLHRDDQQCRDLSPDWVVTDLGQLAAAAGQSNN